MKKLSKRTSEMLRRAGSMLLALAVMMTGITLPEMQVQAAASDQTLYYYYEGDEIPAVQMTGNTGTGGVYTAKAESADYTYTGDGWSTSFYKMTKDETNTGWYSIAMSYDNEGTWGEFGLVTIPASTVSENGIDLTSNPSNWVLSGNAYQGTDTTIRTAFDAGNFYYKDGAFYATMDAAMNSSSGSTSDNEPGDDEGSGDEGTGDDTTVTYTDVMEMHFYTTETEPCLTTSTEIEGLTADGDVWGSYAYLLTSEGNNWWTITTKVPVGTFEIYGNMTGQSGWLMKFSNIETSADGDWEKSYNHFATGEKYYKDGSFYTENPDSAAKTFEDLTALIATAKALTESDYTSDTWATLTAAITAAEALTSESSADDITVAYTTLNAAIEGLKSNTAKKTIYFYSATEMTLILDIWSDDGTVISSGADTASTEWGDKPAFTKVDGLDGWYSIEIEVVPSNLDASAGINIRNAEALEPAIMEISKEWKNTEIWPMIINTELSEVWIKDGAATTSNPDTLVRTMEELGALIEDAEALVESYYTNDSWSTMQTALTAAKAVEETATGTEITTAYNTLSDAMKALVAVAFDKTLYYWNEEDYQVGFKAWDGAQSVAVKEGTDTVTTSWDAPVPVFSETEEYGWQKIEFDFYPAYANEDSGLMILKINGTTEAPTTLLEASKSWSNQTVWETFVNVENDEVYIKGSTAYTSLEEAGTIRSMLQDLFDLVSTYVAEDYETEGQYEAAWNTFVAERTEAGTLLEDENATGEELAAAYDELKAAVDALTSATAVEAEINVKKVELTDDFITGADVSTYITLKNSGVVFKDKEGNALTDQGFFDLLYAGGTNWTRIRVWNDPYSADGKGYGGGNNDLATAVQIGKLATNAGMRVLIDFHYSDFWSDPAKFKTPKAWDGFTLEEKVDAVYDYTYSSLETLKAAGVDVGMVQVGNESNNGICGETGWANMAEIFNAGSQAIRDFNDANRTDILVALHFTDPQKGYDNIAKALDDNDVDYDVFASSYYPNIHGSTDELRTSLLNVAKTYNKKVMVAEMSWPTTWEDGDGHGNGFPKEGQDFRYAISVQGQADALRDIIYNVDLINDTCPDMGIGAFYWEPAWISTHYAYNADGSVNEAAYAKNKALWEQYGSGWAASYAAEYDPVDAGLWYGGSSMDCQSWFDFWGNPLATIDTYALIRTGAKADLKISEVQKNITASVKLGDDIDWDSISTAVATFNDGTTKEYPVVWDEAQKANVTTDNIGEYVIEGVAVCDYVSAEANVTEKHNVTLTIKVQPTVDFMADRNPGFESSDSYWTVEYLEAYEGDDLKSGYTIKPTDETPRTGGNALNFYREGNAMHFKAKQTIENLPTGIYTFGGYVQGLAGEGDLQYAYVNVYRPVVDDSVSDNTVSGNTTTELKLEASYKASAVLGGWQNWMNPEITGINVQTGDVLEVGMEITGNEPGSWGSLDDFYLYGSYDVVTKQTTGGTVAVNNTEAMAGEVVRLTATPNNEYSLKQITLTGSGVNASMIKGTVSDNTVSCNEVDDSVILTYNNNADAVTNVAFVMPSSAVTVSANFVNIFDIDEDDDDEDGKDEDTKVSISDNRVVVSYDDTQYYTGKAIKPAVTVSYLGYTLKEKTDYTVTYSDNIAITEEGKSAKITLTGKGRFTNVVELPFQIVEDNRLNLSKAVVTFTEPYDNEAKKSFYYTGERIEPSVSVNFITKDAAGNKVSEDVPSDQYVVYYQNNVKVGKASVIVVARHDSKLVKGSKTSNMTIAKCPTTELNIDVPKTVLYTGKKLTPDVKVTYGNTKLQLNKDYKITYKNNVNAYEYVEGDAEFKLNKAPYVIVKGIGNYAGQTAKIPFVITKKSLNDVSVSVTVSDLAAQIKNDKAKAQNPVIVVKDGTTTVAKKNYTYEVYKLTVSENATTVSENKVDKVTESGTYKVAVTGKNNYKDTVKDLTFLVSDKSLYLNNAKVTTTNKVYTGKAVTLDKEKGEIVVKINGQKVESKYYTVKTLNNINVGKATVTITPSAEGIEAGYFGTKTATFSITKRKLADAMKVKVEDRKANTGYLVLKVVGEETQYTGYALTPEVEIRTINHGENPIVLALKEGTDYKISYKKNVNAGDTAQITITGLKNYSGKVTFKTNTFVVEDRDLSDFDVKIDSVTYTGKKIKPAIIFTDKATGEVVDLKAGTAYTVKKYYNNINVAGKNDEKAPMVTIVEKGLYSKVDKEAEETKLEKSIKFAINPASIKDANIAVKINKNKPSVTVKANGKTLKEGKDYKVISYTYNSYGDYRGNTYVTIQGIGNFTGTATERFIVK